MYAENFVCNSNSSRLPQVDIFSREFFMEDCAEFVGQWMQSARLQELNNRQTCNEVTLLV